MQSLKYGSDSVGLAIDYPSSWHAEGISSITVQVINTATGSDILAEDDATLFTGSVLTAATARSITLAVTSDTPPTIGKRYRIHETTAADVARNEDIVVLSYDVDDTDEYTLHLKKELQYAHNEGEDVFGCFASYVLDMSDTDTFVLGTECVIVWNPDNDDFPYRTTVMILNQDSGVGNAWQRLSVRYPSAYEVVSKWSTEELVSFEQIIETEFRSAFRRKGLNIAVIQDQTLLEDPYLKYIRMAIYSDLGDSAKHEYEVSLTEWNTSFRELVEATDVWQDLNLDDTKDPNEERPNGVFFGERNI